MEQQSAETVQQARGPSCGTCRARKVKCDRKKPNCTPCRRGCLDCIYAPRAGSARSRLYYDREVKKTQMNLPVTTRVDDFLLTRISNSVNPERPATADGSRPSSSTAVPESINRVSNGLIIHFHGGSSKFFSDVSLVGQVFEVERHIRSQDGNDVSPSSKPLDSSNLEVLRSALFHNSLQDAYRMPVARQYPSRPEIEQAAAIFFQQDCVQWPLYAEDTFRSHLHQFYQTPDSDKCPAVAIGAWHIICDSLRLRISESSPQDPAVAALKQSLRECTNDLYAACMNFLSTPAIIKPCIIDVQALTVTCFAALQHGRNVDFRRALEIACLLAKNIGLHQTARQMNASNGLQEDLWLFWGLYVLDKMSLVGGGNSCLLPSPNCGVPFPSEPPTTPSEVHSLRMARIQLAGIHEQIYTSFYSVEASRRAMPERQQAIASIAAELQQWASSYLPLKVPSQPLGRAAMFSELYAGTKYLYEHSLCLVWNASSNLDDRLKLTEAARRGSDLIAKSLDAMHSHHMDREAREILSLMNAYALAPVLALFRFAVCNTGPSLANEDARLLKRILGGILSYVDHTGDIAQTSDLVQTAKALHKELEWKTSSVEQVSRSSVSSTDALWVSSSLAHIMGTTTPLQHQQQGHHHQNSLPLSLPLSQPPNDLCLVTKSMPSAAMNIAVTTSEPAFVNGTLLPTSADNGHLSRQSSIYGGDNSMLMSPVSMTAQDMSRVASSHSLYSGLESTLGHPYMPGPDLMGPAQHGLQDWGNFHLQ